MSLFNGMESEDKMVFFLAALMAVVTIAAILGDSVVAIRHPERGCTCVTNKTENK